MRALSRDHLVKKVLLVLAFGVTALYAYQDRLPTGLTGGPGEITCMECHNSFPLNAGKALGGSLELVNFPDRYVPDREHFPVKVRLNHPGATRWGFQISARLEDGTNAGHFHVTDVDNTELLLSFPEGVLYLFHTRAGTYGGREGPVEWEFEWHSEDVPNGPITLYVAAVAADNDGTEFGDYVYTATKVIQPGELRSQPFWLCAADLNRDGKTDLVRTNYGSHNITVLLGSDRPEIFSDPTDFVLGIGPYEGPYMAALGDFNGDNLWDLATANSQINTVARLLGPGDGGFGSGRHFPVGREPRAVAAGRLNDDNLDDVVTANWGSDDISVLLAVSGIQGFMPAVHYPVVGRPSFVAMGDLNGDGYLDLVVSNYEAGQLSVFLGQGDGTFAARQDFPAGGRGPMASAIGDFNGDGHSDVVVALEGSDSLALLPGDGTGQLGPAVTVKIGRAPRALVVADFNGDAYLDVAVANFESDTLSILRGQGDGTFTLDAEIPVGQFPRSVVMGDFNDDGILDLATGNEQSNDVTPLLGDGQGGFAHPAPPAYPKQKSKN